MYNMKVGDLVKRKAAWGDWLKYNPWMTDSQDGEIGMIISVGLSVDYKVLWPSGLTWVDEDKLELA